MLDFHVNSADAICIVLSKLPALSTHDLNEFDQKYPKSRKGIKLFDKCYSKFGTLDFRALKDDNYLKFDLAS